MVLGRERLELAGPAGELHAGRAGEDDAHRLERVVQRRGDRVVAPVPRIRAARLRDEAATEAAGDEGAQENSKTAHAHQRGFGPRMDEVCMQSNFGVVTKMGVWLMRRPKRWRAVWVHVEDNEGCFQLIDALRPLSLDGIVRNRVTIMSLLAMATALSQKSQWQEDTGPVTPEVRARMRERFGLGEWNAPIGLFGEPDRMDIDQRLVEAAVAHIPGVRVVSREYADDASAEEVFPPDQAMAGIPNMDLLRMLDWYGHDRPDHVAYAPLAPQTDDGWVLHDLVTHYADDGRGRTAARRSTSRAARCSCSC